MAADPCCSDPCDSLGQWNRANNELNYARMLAATGVFMALGVISLAGSVGSLVGLCGLLQGAQERKAAKLR